MTLPFRALGRESIRETTRIVVYLMLEAAGLPYLIVQFLEVCRVLPYKIGQCLAIGFKGVVAKQLVLITVVCWMLFCEKGK